MEKIKVSGLKTEDSLWISVFPDTSIIYVTNETEIAAPLHK